MDLAPAPDQLSARLSIPQIQATVAAFYELTAAELISPNKQARVAWPRQVAIHLARELTDTPLAGIGAAFGSRSHATVLHACKKVAQRSTADPAIAAEINTLSQGLRHNEADRSC